MRAMIVFPEVPQRGSVQPQKRTVGVVADLAPGRVTPCRSAISEQARTRPKPMLKSAKKPIDWKPTPAPGSQSTDLRMSPVYGVTA